MVVMWAPVSLIGALVLLAAGCGSSDEADVILADSTCGEYMAQPSEARQDAAARISSELGVENLDDSMAGLSLDAACTGRSSTSLEELLLHEDAASDSGDPTQGEQPTLNTEGVQHNSVSGRFVATPEHGDGYTVDVSYDLGQPEVEVDIANAEPGEAILNPIVSGQLTFTNTTPARNTAFGPIYETPYINLYWGRRHLPSASDCADDGLELGGTVHCFLISIRGEIDPVVNADGAVELEPDGEATISVGLTPLGGTAVPEQDAKALSELIRETPPSLVLLNINGLEPACDLGLTGFTAALTGDGEVLGDSENPESC